MVSATPYKISTLIFIQNAQGELLLMQRNKSPNYGLWSCIGGKLEMATGESPYEAAMREAKEEVGMDLKDGDLHLFCMIAEKAYEGGSHWLMFCFDCRKRMEGLPPPMAEGTFAFHKPESIFALPIPETDRQSLWPLWFEKREFFTALRADCAPEKLLDIVQEEQL